MADKKTAIREVIVGDDGQLITIYVDSKTKRRITDLKNYQILNDKDELEAPKDTTKGKKGFAVPLLVRGEDGLNKTIYVDPETGKVVDDISNRNVRDQFSRNLDELGLLPKEEEKKKTGEAKKQERRDPFPRNTAGGFEGPSGYEGINEQEFSGKKATAANNYGYIDKPAAMGFASFLPGPLGMVGKAANVAINANNVGATNKARSMLGMEEKLGIGGLVRDQKGYIGDITYQGETSPVGFEALTRDGRTTLTPDEARMRQQLAGAKEATSAETKANKKEFRKENPRSLISRVFGGVTDAASSVTDKFSPTRTSLNNEPTRGNTYSDGPEYRDVSDPDLPRREMASLDVNLDNAGRSNLPSSKIHEKVRDVVTDTLGPGYSVELYSGQEPEGKSPVGTPYRHPEGFAGDFRIRDPDGNVLTAENAPREMKAIATNMAGRYGANIGFGKGYMGGVGMHLDTMPVGTGQYPGGSQWGASGKAWAGDLNLARAEGVMDPSYYDVDAPTPEERPGGIVAANNINPVGPATARASVDLSRISNFDPDTQRVMARTLAGEIDQRYTDLSTPEGIAEANAIMSTMENRVGTYGSVMDTIAAPKQYSTWGTEDAALTADKNYAASPGTFDKLVSDYTLDERNRMGFTNYYNPKEANPGWGVNLQSRTDIGPHTFGSLPEYRSSFGSNFGQTAMSQTNKGSVGPAPATAGTQAKASTSVGLKSPTANFGGTGSLSDENANRSNNNTGSFGSPARNSGSNSISEDRSDRASRSTGSFGTGQGSGDNKGGSSGMSTSKGSTGGFGVGGDRSSTGKTGGSTGMSSDKGSTGGFGVGGDRSSTGKSSYGGGSTSQSKGAQSRSDGWT